MDPTREITVIGRGGATRCAFGRAVHFASIARDRGRVVMFALRDELGTLEEVIWVGAMGPVQPNDIEALVVAPAGMPVYEQLRRALGGAVQRSRTDGILNVLFALLGDQLCSGPLGLSLSGSPTGLLGAGASEEAVDTSFDVFVADTAPTHTTAPPPKPQSLPPQPDRSVKAYGQFLDEPKTRRRSTLA